MARIQRSLYNRWAKQDQEDVHITETNRDSDRDYVAIPELLVEAQCHLSMRTG